MRPVVRIFGVPGCGGVPGSARDKNPFRLGREPVGLARRTKREAFERGAVSRIGEDGRGILVGRVEALGLGAFVCKECRVKVGDACNGNFSRAFDGTLGDGIVLVARHFGAANRKVVAKARLHGGSFIALGLAVCSERCRPARRPHKNHSVMGHVRGKLRALRRRTGTALAAGPKKKSGNQKKKFFHFFIQMSGCHSSFPETSGCTEESRTSSRATFS